MWIAFWLKLSVVVDFVSHRDSNRESEASTRSTWHSFIRFNIFQNAPCSDEILTISCKTTNKPYLRMKSNICERAQHTMKLINDKMFDEKLLLLLALNHYILWVHVMLLDCCMSTSSPPTHFSRLSYLLTYIVECHRMASAEQIDFKLQQCGEREKSFRQNVPQFADKLERNSWQIHRRQA